MAAERFDVYDEEDRHIGTATREEAHARGLWHHTFHCWLVRLGEDGRPYVLFQKRSESKDTNPGRFDITVAGHLSAGETVRDAAREMDEEIGWSVPFEELVPYGTIREEGARRGSRRALRRPGGQPCIRLPDRGAAGVFRLQQEEVAGLYEAGAEELIALMLGERASVRAAGVRLAPDGTPAADLAELSAEDFVPRDRSYYLGVFRFLRELASRSGSRS